jgi:hypothetical protein
LQTHRSYEDCSRQQSRCGSETWPLASTSGHLQHHVSDGISALCWYANKNAMFMGGLGVVWEDLLLLPTRARYGNELFGSRVMPSASHTVLQRESHLWADVKLCARVMSYTNNTTWAP